MVVRVPLRVAGALIGRTLDKWVCWFLLAHGSVACGGHYGLRSEFFCFLQNCVEALVKSPLCDTR